jgi:hypothetical protein
MPRYIVERTFPDGLNIPVAPRGLPRVWPWSSTTRTTG